MQVHKTITRNLLQLAVFLTTLFVVVGCSGGGNQSLPVAPDVGDEGTESRLELTHAEPGWDADRSFSSSHQLWMYHQVYVDPATREFEIIPYRAASIHWNILSWLEQHPCTDCLSIAGISVSDHGTLLVDLEIKHPFPNPNFTGFDVRGIVMFSGSLNFPLSGHNASDPELGDGALINPDGYTALYNPKTEGCGPDGLQGYIAGKLSTPTYPDATLNAFKRYITDNPANTRNAFYAGDTIVETLDIDMPDGPFIFGYAVDANWATPLVDIVTDPMIDFPLEANCPEPWQISVTNVDIGQGLTDKGGSTKLVMDVYDRGGGNSHKPPVVEVPVLLADTVTATWDGPGSGPGYTRWEATIEIESGHALGEYACLISVEDNENEFAEECLDLTAYQIYMAEVEEKISTDPITSADFEPKPQFVCAPVHFFDDGSYDPDGGAISTYQWDWECDGTYDEFGSEAYHTWDVPGEYCVQFRVTDDEGLTANLDPPLNVEIINALPTALAEPLQYTTYVGEPIDFDGSGSHDNDCDDQAIVQWEWDWDNDGEFDDTYDVPEAEHAYPIPGEYEVQLRVTDDEGGTDVLDKPLIMHIGEYLDPIACGEADTTTPTVCEPVHFTDCGSYDPDGGDIVKHEWDWNNDGVYDEVGNDVYHTWDAVETFYVQYRVTDDEGVTDELDEPIEIVTQNALPTAVASASDNTPMVDQDVVFSGSESYDNDCDGHEIVLYEWDWDNDGNYEETGETVTHSWDAIGICYVQLRVTDDEGGTDTLDEPMVITVTAYEDPVAYADADPNPQTVCEDIHFTDGGSYDPDGGPLNKWEFDWDNDGVYDEWGYDDFDFDITHSWDIPGTYYVQYRVTDDEGATDTLDTPLEIIIENALPTAVAEASTYDTWTDEVITFDGSSSYDGDCDGNEIVLWEWDWENDGIFDEANPFPVTDHAYPDQGVYAVNLRVTDDEGATATLDSPLEIQVVVDGAPWVQLTNCPDTTGSSYTFQWTMGDDFTNQNDLGVEIAKDGVWEQITDGDLEYTWYAIACPDSTFRVRVTDSAGQSDLTEECTFDGADNDPTLQIIDCTPPIFQWSMSDDCTPTTQLLVDIKKDNDSWQPLSPGTTLYNWSPSCPDHTFQVRVMDESGQTTQDSCNFDGLNNPPSVNITNCPSSPVSSKTFYWNMSDDCTNNSQLGVKVRKNGGSWINLSAGSTSYYWSGIHCPNQTFEVQVTDSSGLSTVSNQCNFDGVNNPPSMSITNCPPSPVSAKTFYWNMSDDCTNNSQLGVRVRKNGGSWINLSDGSTSYYWSNIHCPGKTFEVQVTDSSGLSTVSNQCNFDGVDDPPEHTQILSGCDTKSEGTIDVWLSVTADEDCDGPSLLGFQWRKKLSTQSQWPPTWTQSSPHIGGWCHITGLSAGIWDVQVRAKDIAGNYDPIPAQCQFEVLGGGGGNGFGFPEGNGYDGSPYEMVLRYQEYNGTYSNYHLGDDWSAGAGSDVNAVYGGQVVDKSDIDVPATGKFVTLRHDLLGGSVIVHSTYWHLSGVNNLNLGQWVNTGQTVGFVGDTGGPWSPHLHLEMRWNNTVHGDGYNTNWPQGELGPQDQFDPTDFIMGNRDMDDGLTIFHGEFNTNTVSNRDINSPWWCGAPDGWEYTGGGWGYAPGYGPPNQTFQRKFRCFNYSGIGEWWRAVDWGDSAGCLDHGPSGDYGNNELDTAESVQIWVPDGISSIRLEYRERYITEPGDICYVDVNYDDPNWAGWDDQPVLAQYSGTNPGNPSWYPRIIYLDPSKSGQYIKFRFRFETNGSGTNLGWQVDNVRVVVN